MRYSSAVFNGVDPKSMFNNNNFINTSNMIHNNLNSILLNEEIREYSVMIDSKDRNYKVYPNPYSYDVIFGPISKSRDIVNGKVVVTEAVTPYINESISNIRYIKLEEAILPLYTEASYDNGKIVYSGSTIEDLYTVLSIGNYNDDNYKSSNDIFAEGFAVIYYDYKINDTHYRGYTRNGIKIFPQDQLAKLDKLKVRFMNQYGSLMSVPQLDKNISSHPGSCTCDTDNFHCPIHNLTHPLNNIFNHHLQFKIGVIEPRLSKKNFS